MTELRCSVKNCCYNHGALCSKGDICVGGKNANDSMGTCCESFSGGECRGSFQSAMEHPSSTISIDCEAFGCVHNSGYKCMAPHVNIEGNGAKECSQTACATFESK